MRRTALVLLALLAFAGCGRGGAAPAQTQRGDPAVRVALAVLALERSGEQPLTPDQARQVLPLLKVLRDTSPDDRQVSQAIADQILANPDTRPARRLGEDAGAGAGAPPPEQAGRISRPRSRWTGSGRAGPGWGEPRPGPQSRVTPARHRPGHPGSGSQGTIARVPRQPALDTGRARM